MSARYSFSFGDYDSHAQSSCLYRSSSTSALVPAEVRLLGSQGDYGIANVSLGLENHGYSLELFVTNVFDRHAAL